MINQQRNALLLLFLALSIVCGVILLTGSSIGTDLFVWCFLLVVLILIFSLLKSRVSLKKQRIIPIAGLVLILATLVVMLASNENPDPISIMTIVICGIILFVWAWRLGSDDNRDRMIQDERSLKIGTYGISYSWYLTFLVVAILGGLATIGKLSLDLTGFCFLLIILMPFSALFFQWYFNRSGDVF